MNTTRTTRILIVIFVALLGVAYLVNQARRRSAPTPPPVPVALYVFPGVEPTQITRIELENHMIKRTLTLERIPGGWKGTDDKGAEVPVDLNQATRIIQILSSLRYNRVLEGSDVKAFGLADGGLFMVRFIASNKTYTLHIGDLNSALTSAYARRSDSEPVIQIPAIEAKSLVKPVDSPLPAATP
ncbi:MAG: DUF4340 domain-containing protein [Anaerolineae bacterium]|nr:DUF4340 domain-containing protein [Anaerolineae bacterium]